MSGSGHDINVELGLTPVTLNANDTLSSNVMSKTILYQSGPSAPLDILNDYNLAAGTYILDTYLGTCENTTQCTSGTGTSTDPYYAVLFSPVSGTSLPATLPLFAGGLGLMGLLGRRRKRQAAPIAA